MKAKINLRSSWAICCGVMVGLALLIGLCLPTATLQPPKKVKDKLGMVMKRYQQEFMMTVDPKLGVVPRERLIGAYKIAQQRRFNMAQKSGAVPLYWNERGPDNVGGRTRGMIIDANDASGRTIWAGSVSGGLWRTNNIDASPPVWTNIDDFFSNLAITTIAQDPTNPNTIYFGTGEDGFGNADAVRGMGIWRTTDGGTTWMQIPETTSSNFRAINKIVVNGAGWVYAATSQGLYVTTDVDGGIWNKDLGLGAGASGDAVQDIEIAADGTMYAAINGDGVYQRGPTGWTELTTDLPASGFARIELAVAPSDANTVYAAYATTISNSQSTCLNILVTNDAGTSWDAGTCPMGLGVFCWYAYTMTVDPNNPNRVWLGDVGLFVSDDAGTNWTSVGGVHADHHILLYRPGSSTQMVFGNDGGVYRSLDANNNPPTLTAKNDGYNVTQFYANALHPTNDYILGGTQDNGTQRFTCAGVCSTDQPTGADGAFCFVDQDNPNLQITGSQFAWFNISTDAGGSFSQLYGGNPRALFITPAGYDNDTDNFYFSDGRDTLGRIVDIGGVQTTTFDNLSPNTAGGNLSAFAISPNTANRLFVGVTNGRILQIDNADQPGATTVTPLNTPFSSYVSCIAVEDGDDTHLIATTSNYGVVSIYESTDGGTTWENVEGDLPDMPVRWIMFHPFDANQAIIATELGVWTTDEMDGADTEWFPSNSYGLANVRVDMLQYRTSDHLVAAATHGRGMYSTDYFGLLETCASNQAIGGNIAAGLYMVEDWITSDGNIPVDRQVVFQAGEYIELQPGFRAASGSHFLAAIADCGKGTTGSKSLVDEPLAPKKQTEAWDTQLPQQLSMQCYPNPVDYQLQIRVDLPHQGWYRLYVKSMTGQLITTLADEAQAQAGQVQLSLDASNYGAGMYLLTLQTETGAVTERFLVAR